MVPICVLVTAEMLIRIVRPDNDSSFLQSVGSSGDLTANPRFGWRFFPPAIARTPQAFRVTESRSDEVFRVVILGGSAAMGTPDAAFGFARVLEAMLETTIVDRKIEVVNAAMTAVNSHVVRDIARDCERLRPDVVVIYLGNNEVVGPYGPGTVFADLGSNLALVRLSVWLRSLRLGQVMGAVIGGVFRRMEAPAEWKGLEMFVGREVPAWDPRMATVRSHFRQNLEAIVLEHAGQRPVVLCTVASNLADCPPFASRHRTDLAKTDLARWKLLVENGIELRTRGMFDEALAAFREAAAIDDRHAELRYLIGLASRSAGRFDEARKELIEARDLDALRFRADSELNRVIRIVAEETASNGVELVDVAKTFNAASETEDGIPGNRLFFEHVHLRFVGNYRLAAAVHGAIRRSVPQGVTVMSQLPTVGECATRLNLTSWDRLRSERAILTMTSRPPFDRQFGQADRLTVRKQIVRELEIEAHQKRASDLESSRRAVEKRPRDLYLAVKHARLLHHLDRHKEAAAIWHRLVNRLPNQAEWHTELAWALLDSGDEGNAVAEMSRAADLEPYSAEAVANLGVVLERVNDVQAAEAAYRNALERNGDLASARLNLARLLDTVGRRAEAEEEIRRFIDAHPDAAEPHVALAGLHERHGEFDRAMAAYRLALARDPEHAVAWNNLGFLLETGGRTTEAVEAYERAIRADELYARARFNHGDALLALGRPLEAEAAYRQALSLESGNATAWVNLAVALSAQSSIAEAVEAYRRALDLESDLPQALLGLAWILATTDDPVIHDGAEALRLAESAVAALGTDSPEVLEVLGMASAAAGDRKRAVQLLEQARDMVQQRGDEDFARRLGEDLRSIGTW